MINFIKKILKKKKQVEIKKDITVPIEPEKHKDFIQCYKCGVKGGGTLWKAPSGRYAHESCIRENK